MRESVCGVLLGKRGVEVIVIVVANELSCLQKQGVCVCVCV